MATAFESIARDRLRDLVGAKTFGRGAAYHAEGRVRLRAVEATSVQASVIGSEPYRVELRRRGGQLEGTCECPAYDDSGFCKHMVAVALATADAGAGERLDRLRAGLIARGAEALADLVLDLAGRDAELAQTLDSDLADADDDDAALIVRYRSWIDRATDTDQAMDYWGAGSVAEGIGAVLARLEALAAAGRITPAFELAERLIDGLREVVEAADDSEGEIHAVGARVIALHAGLCARVGVDPLQLAEDLFEREMDAVTDLFADGLDTYAEALGPSGRAEHRRLAQAAWAALPRKAGVLDSRRGLLKGLLDRAAEMEGDVDARIALRQAELKDPRAYVEIADLCVAAGRTDEALRWIEEGLWCFEGLPNEELERKAAQLMAAAGRPDEAAGLLWRAFERMPSLRLYREIRDLGLDPAPSVRAASLLSARAEAERRPGPYINGPAQVLFDLQMESGTLDEAWTTATAWGVGEYRLRDLAEATVLTHPREAASAFELLADSRIAAGGAQSYDEAVALIRKRGLARGDRAEQSAYIQSLMIRHKAKRTFIQRLQALT